MSYLHARASHSPNPQCMLPPQHASANHINAALIWNLDDVAVGTVSVKRNENFGKLVAGYLFPEVRCFRWLGGRCMYARRQEPGHTSVIHDWVIGQAGCARRVEPHASVPACGKSHNRCPDAGVCCRACRLHAWSQHLFPLSPSLPLCHACKNLHRRYLQQLKQTATSRPTLAPVRSPHPVPIL